MIIGNVTKEEIEKAAEATGGIRLENFKPINKKADRWNVKVSPDGSKKWGFENPMTGRRVNAINWYGFQKFFRELFKINSEAKIQSTFGIYTGSEDFENRHNETRYKNIGSMMHPFTPEAAATGDCQTGEPL